MFFSLGEATSLGEGKLNSNLLVNMIRSKQLFSAPYVARRCLPDFLVMVISNIISQHTQNIYIQNICTGMHYIYIYIYIYIRVG